jgi:hypothetical protein
MDPFGSHSEGNAVSTHKFALASVGVAALLLLPQFALAAGDAMKYCKPDVERLCPGIEPGGGRIVACLKAHKMDMSVGCAMALKKMKSQM